MLGGGGERDAWYDQSHQILFGQCGYQAISSSTYHVFFQMFDGLALLILRSWPIETSLDPELIELVLRNGGVGF